MGLEDFTRQTRDAREKIMSTETTVATIQFTGTVTTGSPIISAVADTAGLAVGMVVWGTAVQVGTQTIVSIVPNTSVTLSGDPSISLVGATLLAVDTTSAISLQGLDIHLYDSSFSPAVDNVAADFDAAEITFTGWTPPAGVWDAGIVDAQGRAIGESQMVVARPSTTLSTEVSVGGLYVKDGTGGAVWWQLDTPVILTDTTSVLKVLLTDAYPTAGQVVQILP